MTYPASTDALPAPLLTLTYLEAAEVLGVSLATLKRLVRAGDLSVVRFRGCVRIRPEDLARFVDGRTVRHLMAGR